MKGETYYVCKSMKELIAYTKMKRKQRKHSHAEILKVYYLFISKKSIVGIVLSLSLCKVKIVTLASKYSNSSRLLSHYLPTVNMSC